MELVKRQGTTGAGETIDAMESSKDQRAQITKFCQDNKMHCQLLKNKEEIGWIDPGYA